jgi:hypothetical protein
MYLQAKTPPPISQSNFFLCGYQKRAELHISLNDNGATRKVQASEERETTMPQGRADANVLKDGYDI